MNLKHHNNLTNEEFISYYERECNTPLEKVLMNRLMFVFSTTNSITTSKEIQSKLDTALSALEKIADLARGF